MQRTDVDMRSAMMMAALMLNGAKWRRRANEDTWVMTAIHKDGLVSMTRERDGLSTKFSPQLIAREFFRVD